MGKKMVKFSMIHMDGAKQHHPNDLTYDLFRYYIHATHPQ
jgi:hypothetical protein